MTDLVVGTEPWHGKRTGYVGHNCRCDPCREANRRYKREFYARHPEIVGARVKAWKEANKDKVRAANAAWVAANRERRNETLRAWRVTTRDRRRALDKARRDRNCDQLRAYKTAWREQNRERERQLERERRARNLEQVRATDRLYSQLRRARERSALVAPFTKAQLFARMAYWGNRCYVCGVPWQAIDHVKPLSKGGAHCLANFRPICGYHNNRKKDRWRGVPWIREITGAGDVS